MSNTASPFERPTEPKNSLELLRWFVCEPLLLDRFSDSLSRMQFLHYYLRMLPVMILICHLGYLIFWGGGVALDLPARFPEYFKNDVLLAMNGSSGLEAYHAVIKATYIAFIIGLAVGLAGGLAVGLAVGLALGLAVGLAVGLACGLAFGLAFGLAYGLAVGLAVGLAFGLAFGLAVGLAYTIAFLGLITYPQRLFQSWFAHRMDHNPYLYDATILLPLPRVATRLATEAGERPTLGNQFAAFLFEHRPRQRNLAMQITLASRSGAMRQHPLDQNALSEIADQPWRVEDVAEAWLPSDRWLASLHTTHQALVNFHLEHNVHQQLQLLDQFATTLDQWLQQTLVESPKWNHLFLDTLRAWQQETDKRHLQLELEAKNREPISANVYRVGEALHPRNDRSLFMGRDDLKEDLAQRIRTSPHMPMFLLQGQRRVGKTSLLRFLEELLGSGFKLVYQDCQDASVSSIPRWLEDLRRRINKRLDLPDDGWGAPENWLEAWREMQSFLEGLNEEGRYKIILALDEYEILHGYLKAEPEQGERLLGAMRSFSQHQNRVVFLFAGAALFSELRGPDWNSQFVNGVRFPIDYLPEADARRLITEPVELRYPDAVVDRMVALTQGHPALLQQMCSMMVDLANQQGRRDMSMDDLQQTEAKMLDPDIHAIAIFWTQFCLTHNCRDAVRQIVHGETPQDQRAIYKLEEHRFIVPEGEGWRMRVPLFQTWLEWFMDRV